MTDKIHYINFRRGSALVGPAGIRVHDDPRDIPYFISHPRCLLRLFPRPNCLSVPGDPIFTLNCLKHGNGGNLAFLVPHLFCGHLRPPEIHIVYIGDMNTLCIEKF